MYKFKFQQQPSIPTTHVIPMYDWYPQSHAMHAIVDTKHRWYTLTTKTDNTKHISLSCMFDVHTHKQREFCEQSYMHGDLKHETK
jgi:hypothetical protein